LMPMPRVSPSGVTVSVAMVGAAMVRLVDPVTVPSVAEMVAGPAATPVASPLASIVATALADEAQLTSAVRSRLLPSV
jgi:hypothetical protein